MLSSSETLPCDGADADSGDAHVYSVSYLLGFSQFEWGPGGGDFFVICVYLPRQSNGFCHSFLYERWKIGERKKIMGHDSSLVLLMVIKLGLATLTTSCW